MLANPHSGSLRSAAGSPGVRVANMSSPSLTDPSFVWLATFPQKLSEGLKGDGDLSTKTARAGRAAWMPRLIPWPRHARPSVQDAAAAGAADVWCLSGQIGVA